MLTLTIRNLQKKTLISPQRIKKAILSTLASEGKKNSGQVTVCFMTDAAIRELNLMYLGIDRPTDVIAFDLSGNKKELCADLAVSCDTAIRQAKIYNTTPQFEVCLYVIHGILHLLGYDDRTQKQRRIMEKKSKQLLSTLYPVLRTQNVYP